MNKINSIGQGGFKLSMRLIRLYHQAKLVSIVGYGAGALCVVLGIWPLDLEVRRRAALYWIRKGDMEKVANLTRAGITTELQPSPGLVHFISGHGPYKASLFARRLTDTGVCDCVREVTPKHVALECIEMLEDRMNLQIPLQASTVYHILHDMDRWSLLDAITDNLIIVVVAGLPPDVSQVHQPLLVCTAHIHWDPEFCDVKLIQTMMLSNELRGILEDASQSFRPGHKPDTSGIQLLLCGDFNSLPDSGVIEFLTSGRVPADHKDFKALTYKSSLQKISGCDKANEFIHSFKLASAYSEDIMPFTNYTFDFKGIIDYIFYAKSSMTPLGLLGPVAPEWLKENKIIGCPHPHVPSDHFPLLVELEMTPTVPPATNGLISRR
uniref:Endonuclease/exonuclease/phosphatase domain-containing protein n=1 Tax=Timema monikensis TaxID=170555 RepID=A0A7R9E8X8_9NEOP|nr:unnamed protein product [Timema monikensis]